VLDATASVSIDYWAATQHSKIPSFKDLRKVIIKFFSPLFSYTNGLIRYRFVTKSYDYKRPYTINAYNKEY